MVFDLLEFRFSSDFFYGFSLTLINLTPRRAFIPKPLPVKTLAGEEYFDEFVQFRLFFVLCLSIDTTMMGITNPSRHAKRCRLLDRIITKEDALN